MRDNTLNYTLTSSWGGLALYAVPNELHIESIGFTVDVKGTINDLPGGARLDSLIRGHGILTMRLRLTGDSDTQEDRLDTIMSCVQAMYEDGETVTGPTGYLRFDDNDAVTKRLLGLRPLAHPDPQIDGSSLVVDLMFASERPYAVSTDDASIVSSYLTDGGSGFTVPLTLPISLLPSSGGGITFTNSGTAPVGPLLSIWNACTNPVIFNADTNELLALNLSQARQDATYIDMATRRIWFVEQATDPVAAQPPVLLTGVVDASVSTWFTAPVGANNWQLAADTFNSTADPYYGTFLEADYYSGWG